MTAAHLPYDALVVDLDGVFVDGSRSFRQAYRVAAALYLREHLGWRIRGGAGSLVRTAEVQRLKRNPLMNDPADTIAFLILALLVDASAVEADARAELDSRRGAVARGLEALEAAGPEAVSSGDWSAPLLGPLSPAKRAWVHARFDPEVALRLVRECYAGPRSAEVYGLPAPARRGPGLHLRDRLLVDEARPAPAVPLAVLTGRTRGEAALVLPRFRFFDGLPPERVFTRDDGVHKPDPAALARAIAALGGARPLYVGDLPADAETVRRLNAVALGPRCACALVGRLRQAAPADLRARTLEELLDRLARRGEP